MSTQKDIVVVEIDSSIVVSAGEAGPRGEPGAAGLPSSGLPPINFSYGDASPSLLYTLTEDMLLDGVQLILSTVFDGVGASLSVGTLGSPGLYLSASYNDPYAVATYETSPDVIIASGTAIYLTIVPGAGASTGSGKVVLALLPL